MLKIEDGSTAYLASDWGALADLAAQDGGIDFTALDQGALRRLYEAGSWWRRDAGHLGVSRLREQIRNREVCCVSLDTPPEMLWKGKYSADCGWGMRSSSSLADVLTHNLNSPLTRPDLTVGRLSRWDMRRARAEMRLSTAKYQGCAREKCSWIFRSTRRGFSADGYLLRVRGDASAIVPCLRAIGFRLTRSPPPPDIIVGDMVDIECHEYIRRGFGLRSMSVVIQSSGSGVSMRRDWQIDRGSSDAVAVVVATDQNEWDGPSPLLNRMRRLLLTTDSY